MSKKGGYVIVDLKGQNITLGTPFTLDGVTARLDRAKNKACLLSGFAIGNDEKRDVFVDLQPTEDGYAGTVGEYQITIEDDEVTFAEYTDCRIIMMKTASVEKSLSSVVVPSKTILSFTETVNITGDIDPNVNEVICVPKSMGEAGPSLPSGIIYWAGPMMMPNKNRLTTDFYLYNNTDSDITIPENRGVYEQATLIVVKR